MTIARTVTILAVFLGVATPIVAYGHGGGILRLSSKQVAAGGKIAMLGEKMGSNAEFRAELRGVLQNYPMGTLRSGATGTFSANLSVPATARPGTYTLVVIAPDGDVAGRAEVVVEAAAVPSPGGMPRMTGHGPMASMPDMEAMKGMPGMEGTAEMMELDVSTGTGEWIVIGSLILASLGGGAVLLSRSREA